MPTTDLRCIDRHLWIFQLVYVTVLSLYELGQRLGGRALSRLQGMMGGQDGYVDMFGVPDYRARGWK